MQKESSLNAIISNTKYQYFIPIKVPQGAMTNIHL